MCFTLLLWQQAEDGMGDGCIEEAGKIVVHTPGQALVIDHWLAVVEFDLVAAAPVVSPEPVIKGPGCERAGLFIAAGGVLTSLAAIGPCLWVEQEGDERAVPRLCGLAGRDAQVASPAGGDGPHRPAHASILEHHLDGGIAKGIGFQASGGLHGELLGDRTDVFAVLVEFTPVTEGNPSLLTFPQGLAIGCKHGQH
ncbi:MAG: hypothetical protein HOL08_01825, partial [Opitutae bacterium]|nr:hypothetical protein [Opitutae bacterium]